MHPKTAAPGRMRQWKEFGPIDFEVTDSVRQWLTLRAFQIKLLGIADDQQGEAIVRELGQNAFMPKGRTFRARGQIAA